MWDLQEVSVSGSFANVREGGKVTVNQCLQNGIGGQDLGTSGDCSRQRSKVSASVCLDQVMCSEVAGSGVGIEKVDCCLHFNPEFYDSESTC